MKITLQNTSHGLIPLYDSDYDEKKKLKIGSIYKADIKMPRNIDFHRKYFALINCAWEFQNESVVSHFKNSVEMFRTTVEISAGNCDVYYSIARKEWVEQKKSISFGSMKAEDFNDLYNRVKDVLFTVFLKNITEKQFQEALTGF